MRESEIALLRLIHARLSYDRTTGIFTRKRSTGGGARNDRVGLPAGSPHKDGYIAIQIGRKKYLAHRLAWLIVHGGLPEGEIDHINGVRTDNRLCNLRGVSKSVNLQNQRLDHGTLGVDFHKATGKWRARITLDKQCNFIGHFATEAEAQAAYLAEKRRIHVGCTI